MSDKPKKIGDPTVKPGDYIDAGGVPIKVVSQEEINENSDRGRMIFTVLPTSTGPALIPGCRVVRCDDCGCDCWMSPATYSTWQSAGAPVVCVSCTVRRVEARS